MLRLSLCALVKLKKGDGIIQLGKLSLKPGCCAQCGGGEGCCKKKYNDSGP